MLLLCIGPSVAALGVLAVVALAARLPGPVKYPSLYLITSNGELVEDPQALCDL